jgi:pentatricopeptide repeat protein
MQGKVHLVDQNKVQVQLNEWKKEEKWSSLARAYCHLGLHDEAVECYCLYCIRALKDGRHFSAGFYLKEMIEKNLVDYLFERALQQAKEEDNIWWQIRSLQELERDNEIDELVLRNRRLIESKGMNHELMYLRSALKRRAVALGSGTSANPEL